MNIYTASNDLIAGFSTGVTLDSTLLTSGSSNIVSISPSVSTVQTSSVTYNMIFKPESPLVNSATEAPKIIITFPSSITLASI